MLKIIFVIILMVVCSPSWLQKDFPVGSYWIVWNVGQGQWSTLVDEKNCYHFDMGGEKSPLNKVRRLCRDKNNILSLSHWDWDHVSFALKAQKVLPNACLQVPPLGKTSAYKMKILRAYQPCSSFSTATETLRELTHFHDADFKKKTNDLSHVLLVKERILIPGDSPARQESLWSSEVGIQKTRFLLLGHHGSRTSTSEELLLKLPLLKTAVASARLARYGHPHQEVVRRLQKYHVPLLKTEDWGNIWFKDL